MIFSASTTASANDWVSTGKPPLRFPLASWGALPLRLAHPRLARSLPAPAADRVRLKVERVLTYVNDGLRGPAVRRDPEARQVVERHHGLVGANVAGVRDPPPAGLTTRVPVLVERRSRDHHA